jgi:hypothetical protein
MNECAYDIPAREKHSCPQNQAPYERTSAPFSQKNATKTPPLPTTRVMFSKLPPPMHHDNHQNPIHNNIRPHFKTFPLPFPLLIPSNFFTSASCTFLFPAHASRIFCMRSEATTAKPSVRSEGFFSRIVASGVMPIVSRRRRSAELLLYQKSVDLFLDGKV